MMPAGLYAVVMHVGSYETLVDTTAALLDLGKGPESLVWARRSGMAV